MPEVILTGSEWVWLQDRALPRGTTPGQELHRVLEEAMTRHAHIEQAARAEAEEPAKWGKPGRPTKEWRDAHPIGAEYEKARLYKAGRGG